jgi:aminoacrylate hydrolase
VPQLRLSDGESLYYETHGAGPAVLLVAGLGGLATFWNRHLDTLARQFTVVLHDHRGCGRSSHSRISYSVEQMARDVVELMDGLGIAKAHYVGHSTGGAIGQVLALDYAAKIDGLVLSSTLPAADIYVKRLFDVRSEALEKLGAEFYSKLGNLVLYPPSWLAQNFAALEAVQARSEIPATPTEIVKSRIAAVMRHDRTSDLPRIPHRTLVSCARDDAVTPAYLSEALARAIPNSRLVIFPTGGHFYNHVSPHEFERMVVEFLRGEVR